MLEGLLKRHQNLWQVRAVSADDLVQHRVQPWQFLAERLVIAGLNVLDERRKAGAVPRGLGRRRRGGGAQFHEERVEIQATGRACLFECHLAAAAEIDLVLLKDADGRGRVSGDRSDSAVWCNHHVDSPSQME